MAEKIVVHQNHKLETIFMISDPQSPDLTVLKSIDRLYDLSPYGMLLASLGSCTALTVNTYAQNNHIHLNELEITLEYSRVFKEDCENCDRISNYDEVIQEKIVFNGDLSPLDTDKLTKAAHLCPVYKMLNKGVRVNTQVTGTAELREEEKENK